MNRHLQKKKHLLSLLIGILLTSLLGLFSCTGPDPDPAPDKEEIPAEEGAFFPMEIAQLSLKSEKAGTGNLQGVINGQPVDVQLFDTLMVFTVPDVAPGVYELEAPHGDKILTSSITVKELVLTDDPEQIFQQTLARNKESIERLTASADRLSETDKVAFLKDVQTINGWLTNARKHYAELSPDEKLQFAKTMAANQWWLDEVHAAVVELSADVNSYRTTSAVEDWEERLMNTSRKYVNATIALVKHVPKIAKMAAGGAAVGTVIPVIGTSVGAAVGAGIEIGSFLYDYMQHTGAMHNVLDASIEPVLGDDFESMRLAAEKVEFISKEAKELKTSTSYRTLYSQDQDSSIPIVKTFAGAFSQTEGVWKSVSPLLPDPLSPPKMLEDVPSFSKTKREIHSNYLEVSDISNDNVVLLKKEEKDGRLVLTFENKAAADQEFTYKLSYTNSNFSPGFSKTFNAEITGLSKVLMDGSPWKLTAFAAGKSDFFALNNTGNIACGEKGDLYDHKRRVTGGTYSFSEGTLSTNISIDYHTYSCSTKTYDVSSRDSGGSLQWKIDPATDKFVLMAGEDEWAWLTAVVSDGGKKISFSGIAEGVEEDEETSSYSFTIEK